MEGDRTVQGSSSKLTEISRVPALILAGGLGTRLRPVFDSGPKSMAPVGGRPFLEYLLLQISRAGFSNVLLCVGYGQTQVEEWVGDGKKWGMNVRYSREPRLIDDEFFLVLNGDSFLAVDLCELVREHLRHAAWGTIALAKVRDAARYGTVTLRPNGEIEAFLEKSTVGVCDPSGWYLVNGGVYVFNRLLLSIVPHMTAVSLEREVFPPLLKKGLKGLVTDGYFIDIGLPDDFKRAQTELPEHF
jgi:NDP-sugar pyrophosphorylase family protein